MGFLDVLFAKKKENDKNWQKKLGRMLVRKKKIDDSYDALYLYYYYVEANILSRGCGHYDYFAQNFELNEKYDSWNEIYRSINKQLPQGLKENFNAAFEYYKNNYKKAEFDEDGKFIDGFDKYDFYFQEHIEEVEEILHGYYKKLINK